jgi:pyruvate kinase
MAGLRVMRKTKIVATVGPACSDPDTLTRMIEAGMNVARFNFSHESHEGHAERLDMLRNAANDLGVPVATMLDTKGAEVRTGTIQNGEARLEVGKPFALFAGDELGDASGVSVSFPDLVRQVRPGASIRIDDGLLELRVESNHPDELRCVVVRGGELGNHKGINVPGAPILVDGLNEANRADLRFAVEHGIDYIAASFMQRPEDVQNIRRFLRECGGSIPIIAKIENREGLNHLEPWWPAATWAWSWRRRRCPQSRSASSAPPSEAASPPSPPPRCSTPWSAIPSPRAPRPATWPTPSWTAARR